LSDLGHLVKFLDVNDVSKINLNLSSSNALDNLAILSEMIMDTHLVSTVYRTGLFFGLCSSISASMLLDI
jgi:hypothetical protein